MKGKGINDPVIITGRMPLPHEQVKLRLVPPTTPQPEQPALFDGAPLVQLKREGKKRKPTKANGYAALPGTGPAGETCGTCAHHVRRRWSKVYNKCALRVDDWTMSTGTDIRVSSPACSKFKKQSKEEIA